MATLKCFVLDHARNCLNAGGVYNNPHSWPLGPQNLHDQRQMARSWGKRRGSSCQGHGINSVPHTNLQAPPLAQSWPRSGSAAAVYPQRIPKQREGGFREQSELKVLKRCIAMGGRTPVFTQLQFAGAAENHSGSQK